MHWDFYCPGCDQLLQGRPGEEHAFSRCPGCGAHFRTPGPPPPPAPSADTGPGSRALWLWGVAAAAVLLLVSWLGWKYWPRARRHGAGPRNFAPDSGQMKVTPKQPEEHLFALQRASTTSPSLSVLPPEGAAGARAVSRVADIGPVLAVAFAAESGPAFSATPGGELRVHDRATFAVRASYRLPSPASELALAPKGGRLFAALARSRAVRLGRLARPERPSADLALFNVEAILRGTPPPASELNPVKVISLGSEVHSIALSHDGARAYCLALADSNLHLSLFDPRTGEQLKHVTFPYPPNGQRAAIALPPDEGLVFVVNGLRVLTFSPDLSRQLDLPVQLRLSCSPVALGGGHLALLSRPTVSTQVSHVIVLNMREHKVAQRWHAAVPGVPALGASADGRRLWLATSAVLGGGVVALEGRGPDQLPVLVGRAHGKPFDRICGRLFVSPDGELAALSNGLVFQAGP